MRSNISWEGLGTETRIVCGNLTRASFFSACDFKTDGTGVDRAKYPMRSQSLPVLLQSEAKRKPELAALIARVDSLTDEEIATAPGLPWVRKALAEMRGAVEDVAMTARILARVTTSWVEDGQGVLAQIQSEGWIKVERDNQILVNCGELVWLPDTGGCWIGSIFTQRVTPELLARTRQVRRCTKSEYSVAQRDRTIGNNPELKTAAVDPDDRGLFRIIRH